MKAAVKCFLLQNMKFSEEEWQWLTLFDRKAIADINKLLTSNYLRQEKEVCFHQKGWPIGFLSCRFITICFRGSFQVCFFFVNGVFKFSFNSEPELCDRFDLLTCYFFRCTARGAKYFCIWELLIPKDFTWLFDFSTNTGTSELRVDVIKLKSEASFCMSRSNLGKRFFGKKRLVVAQICWTSQQCPTKLHLVFQ